MTYFVEYFRDKEAFERAARTEEKFADDQREEAIQRASELGRTLPYIKVTRPALDAPDELVLAFGTAVKHVVTHLPYGFPKWACECGHRMRNGNEIDEHHKLAGLPH